MIDNVGRWIESGIRSHGLGDSPHGASGRPSARLARGPLAPPGPGCSRLLRRRLPRGARGSARGGPFRPQARTPTRRPSLRAGGGAALAPPPPERAPAARLRRVDGPGRRPLPLPRHGLGGRPAPVFLGPPPTPLLPSGAAPAGPGRPRPSGHSRRRRPPPRRQGRQHPGALLRRPRPPGRLRLMHLARRSRPHPTVPPSWHRPLLEPSGPASPLEVPPPPLRSLHGLPGR